MPLAPLTPVSSSAIQISPQQMTTISESTSQQPSRPAPVAYYDIGQNKPHVFVNAQGEFRTVYGESELRDIDRGVWREYTGPVNYVGVSEAQRREDIVSQQQQVIESKLSSEIAKVATGGTTTEFYQRGLELPSSRYFTKTEPITTAPKPGEYGYHATAERPGGIVQPEPLTSGRGFPMDIPARLPDIQSQKLPPDIGIEKYTTYPLFQKGHEISSKLQSEFEKMIGLGQPAPRPFVGTTKAFIAGGASFITGLPEFAGSVALGSEIIVRQPGKVAANLIPAGTFFASSQYEAATQDPAKFAGQIAAMFLAGKAATKGIEGLKSVTPEKMFGRTQISGKELAARQLSPEATLAMQKPLTEKMFGTTKESPISTLSTELTEYGMIEKPSPTMTFGTPLTYTESVRASRGLPALTAGVAIVSSTKPTQADITSKREAAYDIASKLSEEKKGITEQVIPPHSPVEIRTNLEFRGAAELADKIALQMRSQGFEVTAKGTEIFTQEGGKVETIAQIDYFNMAKIQAKMKFDKGFGSENLKGMDVLGVDLKSKIQVADLSNIDRYFGMNPADRYLFGFSDVEPYQKPTPKKQWWKEPAKQKEFKSSALEKEMKAYEEKTSKPISREMDISKTKEWTKAYKKPTKLSSGLNIQELVQIQREKGTKPIKKFRGEPEEIIDLTGLEGYTKPSRSSRAFENAPRSLVFEKYYSESTMGEGVNVEINPYAPADIGIKQPVKIDFIPAFKSELKPTTSQAQANLALQRNITASISGLESKTIPIQETRQEPAQVQEQAQALRTIQEAITKQITRTTTEEQPRFDLTGRSVFKIPFPEKTKRKPVKAKGKEKGAYFATFRASPIKAASTDLSSVRKSMGLIATKKKKKAKK